MFIITILAATVAGVVMTALSPRGRRLGPEPRCRRCSYGLSGGLGAAVPSTCPKCGTSLDGPGAIATGQRRASLGPVAIGIALPLLCVGLAALVLSRIDSPSIKPTWWLVIEARHAEPLTSDAAATELHARLVAGTVDLKDHPRLVAAALAVQADATREWHGSAWPSVLGMAASEGLLTPEQADAATMFDMESMTLQASPFRLYPGAPVPGVTLNLPSSHRPSDRVGQILLAAEPVAARLNGVPVTFNRQSDTDKSLSWKRSTIDVNYTSSPSSTSLSPRYLGSTTRSPWPSDLADTSAWPLGTHTLEIDWVVRRISPDVLAPLPYLQLPNIRERPSEELILGTARVTTPVQVRVFDKDDPGSVLNLVTGEQQWPPQHSPSNHAIRVVKPMTRGVADAPITTDFDIEIDFNLYWPASYDELGPVVHHRVWLIIDGVRVPVVGYGDKPAILSSGWADMWASVRGLPRVDEVEILLTPDLPSAASSSSIHALWNQDILIPDVPVDWSAIDQQESKPDR